MFTNIQVMKTKALLLTGLLFLCALALKAQPINESDVPQDVFISFKYKYPDAVVSGWEKSGENYMAKFKLTDEAGKAEFTAGGKWLRSVFSVGEKELPTPVLKYVKANYPDHMVKESSLQKAPEVNDEYEIVLKEQGIKDQVLLYFDIEGALLRKVDAQENKANQVKKENPDKVVENNGKTNENGVQDQQVVVQKKDEGEPVNESKVPAVAKTHFLSKNKKAANVAWFRMGRDYEVRYVIGGRNARADYAEDGKWKETRVDSDPATLSPLILDYLKSNFRKLKTTKAEFVQQAPKTKFFEVSMVEKSAKTANPPVTKVYFDGNGKYMSVERPDVEDPNANKAQEEADKEFMANVDATNQAIETGTGVNDVVNPKELPTDAMSYIKKTFPEHKIKECRYLFDDDLNAHIYWVTVKKEGDKYEIELSFDLAGKLLKKIDPTEQKYNNENLDGGNSSVNSGNQDAVVDEFISGGAETINPKELPSGITSYLKKNYPEHKVEEALFTTDEEFGNVYYLQLKKSGDKTLTELWFDLNGKLVKSEIPE